MRFTLGFVAGVILGRPILSVVNEYLTPPVRNKLADGVNALADYLNSRIADNNQENEQ
jgi:hypothetical protein